MQGSENMKQMNITDYIDEPDPYGRPPVGTKIYIRTEHGIVPAIVKKICGYDFFYVESEETIFTKNFLNLSMRCKNEIWFLSKEDADVYKS